MNPRITKAAELLAELTQAKAETVAARAEVAAAQQREAEAEQREVAAEARFLAFLDGKPDLGEQASKPKKGGFGPRKSPEDVRARGPTPSVPKQLRAYFAANPDTDMSADKLLSEGHIIGEIGTIHSKLNVLCRKGYLKRVGPGRFQLAQSAKEDA